MVCTSEKTAPRIAGGFVMIPVVDLIVVWRACQARPLGTGDFRTWLACHEARARRCGLGSGRSPVYTHAELARLLGVSERLARASIRRLVAVGLLTWTAEGPVFTIPPALDGRGLDDRPGPGLADSIGGGRGSIAIPRRIFRLLADGARPAKIATALAVLFRCLSRRRAGWDGRGRLKSSWVARTFGVSLRQVKAARGELVDLGWIAPEASDHWAEQRWGRAYRINLEWSRSSPRAADPGASSSPPDLHPEPLPGVEHQEPAGRGPGGTGAWLEGRGEGPPAARALAAVADTSSGPAGMEPVPTTTLPAPRLDDVRPEDLRGDVGRTLELHRQAVARKLVDPSEAGRLRFVALAIHAATAGKANPPGLFAALLRRGAWDFITGAEEDTARRRLKAYLHPAPMAPPPMPARRMPPAPPTDSAIVAEVRRAFFEARIDRDPWPAFSARNPGWDRGRWDAALAGPVEIGL